MPRAVILLVCACLVPLPALAADRAGTRAPRASAAAVASARAFLCPNGGTPQGRGRCARGAGQAAAGLGGVGFGGDDPSVRDWDQGLAPPNRAQRPCPPGTIATTARDQPAVTRCVAG